MQVFFSPDNAFAFETVTIDGTARSLTAATYLKQLGSVANQVKPATRAFVTVRTADINISLVAGVTPTATTNGHKMGSDISFELFGAQIADFKAIRATGTSATIDVTYFLG